jgi:hypothetical protein
MAEEAHQQVSGGDGPKQIRSERDQDDSEEHDE